jgi:DNA polymerase III epsilon subunit-like protein
MKYFAIDIETTSLSPKTGQILEFGAIYDDGGPIESLKQFHCYVLPPDNVFIGEAYALQMNYKILERIALRKEPHNRMYNFFNKDEVAYKLLTWLSEFGATRLNFAGKNAAGFDLPFCEAYLGDFSRLIQYRHRVIDVGNHWVDFENDEALPDLKTCLKRAGLGEPTGLHTALGDCMDVVRLVRAKFGKGN